MGNGGPQRLQLGDLAIEAGQSAVEQLLHVRTGGLAAVSDLQDLSDLSQGQPSALAAEMKSRRLMTSGE